MGTVIISTKPINVVSGTTCVYNNEDWPNNKRGTYAASVPSSEFLSQKYVVPNIIQQYMDDVGCSITVVATDDGTIVESDGDSRTVDRGETAIFEYPVMDRSIFVTCSKNCLVTQYSKVMSEGSSIWSGLFMQNLLSENDFSTSHFFTTLDMYPVSYLSLVLKGEAPGDDLYLNGASLDYLNWNPIHGYSTAELAIPEGVYELYSADDRPFTAYVYLHLIEGGGAGYPLLPMESSGVSPSPVPTTPSPSENGTFPYHTARVNGTARTEDGEDMSQACIMVSLKYLKHVTYCHPRQRYVSPYFCLFGTFYMLNC